MNTVTAILPTYNRAHTLGRALASVFGQTRVPDEVIVVDDASTDETPEILGRFPKARLLRLEQNGGAARARNAGVRAARSEFIAFIDSDDLWLSNKLEAQFARMRAAPQIGLLCTGITVRERTGKVAYHGFDYHSPPTGWTFAEFQTYPFSTPTWLIRRSVLLEMGLFDESLSNCEDLDFLARLIGRHGVEVLPEPLTVKYNQSDSINSDLARTARSYEILFERHHQLWAKTPAAAAIAHQRLANMFICSGDMGHGRAALLRAARVQPRRLKYWALTLMSLLGRRVYIRARRLRV